MTEAATVCQGLSRKDATALADDLLDALDLSVQALIINLLLELMNSRALGLVLVSHDLAVIRHLTTEILVMYEGRIVERGATHEVLADPQHPYTKQLLASVPWTVHE